MKFGSRRAWVQARTPKGSLVAASCAAFSLSLSGCAPAAQLVSDAVVQINQINLRPHSSDLREEGQAYVREILEAAGREQLAPGLVVFDPVDASNTPFGAGCARWVAVQSAGQFEFGRSPTWGTYSFASRALSLPNARLDGEHARRAAESMGVTHYVTSAFSGAGRQGQLSFTLQALEEPAKTLGQWSARGDAKAIVAALPAIATAIAREVGAPKPLVAPQVGLTPVQLAAAGSYMHRPQRASEVPRDQARILIEAADADLLAAVMAARGYWYHDATVPHREAIARAFAPHIEHNAYAMCELSLLDTSIAVEHLETLVPLRARFASNGLLHLAAVQTAESTESDEQEALLSAWQERIEGLERVLQSAPDSMNIWLMLADAHAECAGVVRQGRFASQLSRDEWNRINPFYARAVACAERAVEIMPGSAQAHATLATKATFMDTDQAVDALETALRLDPNDPDALFWGLQLFQPKWTGDIEAYIAFAGQAAARADRFEFPGHQIWHILAGHQREDQVLPILEAAYAANPKSASINAALGHFLHYKERDYERAEPHYRAAIAADPNEARATGGLADLTHFVHGDNTTAEALYRRAVTLEDSGYNNANLGRFLASTGRATEGARYAQAARDKGFKDPNHAVWSATGVTP